MKQDFKPSVLVQLGDDGNSEIKIDGTTDQAKALCVALLAGLAMETEPDNIEGFFMGMVISTADLLNRMEKKEA